MVSWLPLPPSGRGDLLGSLSLRERAGVRVISPSVLVMFPVQVDSTYEVPVEIRPAHRGGHDPVIPDTYNPLFATSIDQPP